MANVLHIVCSSTRQDILLPLATPVKSTDGKAEIREISLRRNTDVFLNIRGANTSKEVWGEDADDWKPERWLNTLPQSVADAKLPGIYSFMCVAT